MYWIIFAVLIAGYFIYKAIKNNDIRKDESLELSRNNLAQEFIDWEKLANEHYNDSTDGALEKNKKITEILKKLPDLELKSFFERYLRIIKALPEMKLRYVRFRERYRLASPEDRIKTVQLWVHYLAQIRSMQLFLYGYYMLNKGNLETKRLNDVKEHFVALDERKKIFEEMLNKDL